MPRIDVFQTAFNAGLHDLMEASRQFNAAAMKLLPVDRLDGGGMLPWAPPSRVQMASFDEGRDTILHAVSTLHAYAGDFQVEMQKALLGELFSHDLPVRRPPDPGSKVITLANADELTRHFEEETPWGEAYRTAMSAAHARFGTSPVPRNSPEPIHKR